MIQCRLSGGMTEFPWKDYGRNIGFIAAAKKHAEAINLEEGWIDVRDSEDLNIPIGEFKLFRKVTYEVSNPRQCAD